MHPVQTTPILSPERLLQKGLMGGAGEYILRLLGNTAAPQEDSLAVHQRLVALGKDASQSPQWRGDKGHESEEFLTWRSALSHEVH